MNVIIFFIYNQLINVFSLFQMWLMKSSGIHCLCQNIMDLTLLIYFLSIFPPQQKLWHWTYRAQQPQMYLRIVLPEKFMCKLICIIIYLSSLVFQLFSQTAGMSFSISKIGKAWINVFYIFSYKVKNSISLHIIIHSPMHYIHFTAVTAGHDVNGTIKSISNGRSGCIPL